MEKKPRGINPQAARLISERHRKLKPAKEYIEGILAGDRVALGQAITLVESETESHRQLAQEIIAGCLPHSGNSIRIGITGSPGVGKSTFIESLGLQLIEEGQKLGVLAIDPSSQVSRGSILGDKTRMNELSRNPAAFIRPSAAGSSLGGVARKTRETIILCEAAGFNVILIETVGVGQSEIAVHSMTDFFLLLLLPGGGDELQGIKRGIVEMADLLVVNKADGEREKLATQSRQAYRNALHLFPPKENDWTPRVLTSSGLSGKGIPEVWKAINEFVATTRENGHFEERRLQQRLGWFRESIEQGLKERFFRQEKIASRLGELEAQVQKGAISPFLAAEQLLSLFFSKED
jgi:LAO/AO transport system kinase